MYIMILNRFFSVMLVTRCKREKRKDSRFPVDQSIYPITKPKIFKIANCQSLKFLPTD